MSFLCDATGEELSGQLASTYGYPITIACWQKVSDYIADNRYSVNLGNSASLWEDSIAIRNAANADSMAATSIDSIEGLSTAVRAFDSAGQYDNVWLPVLATFVSNTERHIYYGDITQHVESTEARTITETLDFISIGNTLAGSGTAAIDGLIAHPAIWNSELSTVDIIAYLGSASKTDIEIIDPSNRIAYYPLDYDNSTQLNLGSDAGGNLTVTNATYSADDPFVPVATAYTGWSASNYLNRAAAVYETRPVCISAWVYFDGSLPVADQDIYSHGTSGVVTDRRNVYFSQGTTAFAAFERSSGTYPSAQTTGGESAGVWQHVFAEYVSATDRAISVDAANRGTDTDAQTPAAGVETRIGYGIHNGSPFRSTDAIASVSVWDATGMSAAERLALRDQLQSGNLPEDVNAEPGQSWTGDAKAIWSLDPNDANGGLNDLTGNGHTLSEVGTLSTWVGDPPPTIEPANYPRIEDSLAQEFATGATSHNVAMPATVLAGEKLFMFLTIDTNTVGITVPTGWEFNQSYSGTFALTSRRLFTKTAVGDEGGTNVAVVLDAARTMAAIVYRISNWRDYSWPGSAGGSVTPADSPTHSPSWGAADTLWLSVAHTGDDGAIATDAPPYYSSLLTARGGSTVNEAPGVHSAHRFLNRATEDPGAFTLSDDEDWKAYTVAIQGGSRPDVSPIVRSIEHLSINVYNTNHPVTVNLSKGQNILQCTPKYSVRSDGPLGDDNRERQLKIEFVDNDGQPAVKISQDLAVDSDQVLELFVIEWAPKITVEQRAVTGLTDTTTSYNQTVNDVFSQSSAFFTFSYQFDVTMGDALYDKLQDAMIQYKWNGASTTSINLSRVGPDGGVDGILYIVKCSAAEFIVEHLAEATPAIDAETGDITCASTVMDRTFLIHSNKTDDALDDMKDTCWQVNLTTATNVHLQRGDDAPSGSSANATISVQVVECQNNEWSVQRGTMTMATVSEEDTIATVDRAKSFAKIGHNIGSISCSRNDSASGDAIEGELCAIDFGADDTVRVRKEDNDVIGGVIEYEVVQFANVSYVAPIEPSTPRSPILIRKPWMRKPPYGTKVKTDMRPGGSSIVSEVARPECVIALNSSRLRDELDPICIVTNNGASLDVGPYGSQYRFIEGNSDYITVANRKGLDFGWRGLTILSVFMVDDIATDQCITSQHGLAGDWLTFRQMVRATTGLVEMSVMDSTSNAFPTWRSTEVVAANTPYVVASTWAKDAITAADCDMAINGEIQSLAYTANNYQSNFNYQWSGTDDIAIGRQENDTPDDYFDGAISLVVFFRKRLTPVDLVNLTKNPWQIFEPRTIHMPKSKNQKVVVF